MYWEGSCTFYRKRCSFHLQRNVQESNATNQPTIVAKLVTFYLHRHNINGGVCVVRDYVANDVDSLEVQRMCATQQEFCEFPDYQRQRLLPSLLRTTYADTK